MDDPCPAIWTPNAEPTSQLGEGVGFDQTFSPGEVVYTQDHISTISPIQSKSYRNLEEVCL